MQVEKASWSSSLGVYGSNIKGSSYFNKQSYRAITLGGLSPPSPRGSATLGIRYSSIHVVSSALKQYKIQYSCSLALNLLTVDQTVSLRAVEIIVLSSMLKDLQTNCHRQNYELVQFSYLLCFGDCSNIFQLMCTVADANR